MMAIWCRCGQHRQSWASRAHGWPRQGRGRPAAALLQPPPLPVAAAAAAWRPRRRGRAAQRRARARAANTPTARPRLSCASRQLPSVPSMVQSMPVVRPCLHVSRVALNPRLSATVMPLQMPLWASTTSSCTHARRARQARASRLRAIVCRVAHRMRLGAAKRAARGGRRAAAGRRHAARAGPGAGGRADRVQRHAQQRRVELGQPRRLHPLVILFVPALPGTRQAEVGPCITLLRSAREHEQSPPQPRPATAPSTTSSGS